MTASSQGLHDGSEVRLRRRGRGRSYPTSFREMTCPRSALTSRDPSTPWTSDWGWNDEGFEGTGPDPEHPVGGVAPDGRTSHGSLWEAEIFRFKKGSGEGRIDGRGPRSGPGVVTP